VRPPRLIAIISGAPSLAAQLKPEDAQVLSGQIGEALEERMTLGEFNGLIESIAAITSKLPPQEAHSIIAQAFERVMDDLRPGDFFTLASGIAALTPQLKSKEVHALAGRIVEEINVSRDMPENLPPTLAAVAHQLNPEEASAFSSQAVNAIEIRMNKSRRFSVPDEAYLALANLMPEDSYKLAVNWTPDLGPLAKV
jgi:hypothetical protein